MGGIHSSALSSKALTMALLPVPANTLEPWHTVARSAGNWSSIVGWSCRLCIQARAAAPLSPVGPMSTALERVDTSRRSR